MHQIPRRRAHVLNRPGPDGDGEQHHVGRGEAGDGDGAQQGALLLPCAAVERSGVVGDEAIAEPLHRIDEARCIARRAPPGEREPPGREVDPCGSHARLARERLFDLPHALATVDAVHEEAQRVAAVPRLDVWSERAGRSGMWLRERHQRTHSRWLANHGLADAFGLHPQVPIAGVGQRDQGAIAPGALGRQQD